MVTPALRGRWFQGQCLKSWSFQVLGVHLPCRLLSSRCIYSAPHLCATSFAISAPLPPPVPPRSFSLGLCTFPVPHSGVQCANTKSATRVVALAACQRGKDPSAPPGGRPCLPQKIASLVVKQAAFLPHQRICRSFNTLDLPKLQHFGFAAPLKLWICRTFEALDLPHL
ncbi:hypothetical protein ES703_38712 [subsurface metagenome]